MASCVHIVHTACHNKTTQDIQNTPTITNLEEEEIVDAPGKDDNASTPEQVKRLYPWRKMMMMIIINLLICLLYCSAYV